MFYPFRLRCCELIVLLSLICIGCGQNVPGEGTITFSDGQVVPTGSIFFSTAHYNYRGEIKDGFFTLGGFRENDGLPPGTYNVYVIGSAPTDGSDQEVPLFASKYTNAETSGLVAEVVKGQKNRFDFIVERP